MNLYPPLKQTSSGTPRDLGTLLALLSQKFGDNPQIYSRFIVPAPGGGTMPMKGHNGLDWPCNTGTPIYASHDGKVSNQIDSDAGKGVVLTTQGFKTIYWHLDSYAQADGASVKRGDIIGHSDNTGFSTGPHLHFGLKLLDANGNVLDRDNGYDGAVDPTPFMVWAPLPQTTDNMSETEVKDMYKLAFYRLPSSNPSYDPTKPTSPGVNEPGELEYWKGKPLQSFLDTAIADRAKFLAQPL